MYTAFAQDPNSSFWPWLVGSFAVLAWPLGVVGLYGSPSPVSSAARWPPSAGDGGPQPLFGVTAWDLPTLATVAAVLGGSALVASYIPARRAASLNPVDALRAE